MILSFSARFHTHIADNETKFGSRRIYIGAYTYGLGTRHNIRAVQALASRSIFRLVYGRLDKAKGGDWRCHHHIHPDGLTKTSGLNLNARAGPCLQGLGRSMLLGAYKSRSALYNGKFSVFRRCLHLFFRAPSATSWLKAMVCDHSHSFLSMLLVPMIVVMSFRCRTRA